MMKTSSLGSSVRPFGQLIPSSLSVNKSKRANVIHLPNARKDEVDRLETFFGVGSEDVMPPSHRYDRLPDDASTFYPTPTTTTAAEQPTTSALERLSALTTDQLNNLQAATQHAMEILQQLRGSAEHSLEAVRIKAQHAQQEITPEVQHLARALNAHFHEVQEAIVHASVAVKERTTAAVAPLMSPLQNNNNRADVVRTTTTAIEEQGPSVKERFKSEVSEGLAYLETLTVEGLHSLRVAAVVVQEEATRRAEQAKLTFAQQQQKLTTTIRRRRSKSTNSERGASSLPGEAAAAAPPPSRLSKMKTSTEVAIINLPSTVEAMKDQLRVHLPSFSLPPTPKALAQLQSFDSLQLKAVVERNPVAVATASGVLVVAILRWTLGARARRNSEAEVAALSRARSRRSLDRQRNRFKQALGAEAALGVDSSVFAAVQKLKPRSNNIYNNNNNTNSGAAVPFEEEEGGDEEEEEEDTALLSEEFPSTWDPQMRKEWESFVKDSRMKDSVVWDADDVDAGLPKVWVDLERD